MIMHSIRRVFAPGLLMISDWDGPEEVYALETDRSVLRRLLGAIVFQAMDDRMLRLRIGVDCASGEPFMKYFGPADYSLATRVWWDTVPPPPEHYPRMLQVCLSLANLEAQLPIRGVIPATRVRRRLNLQFAMAEMESFELAWAEEFASEASGKPTVIDRPSSEGKEAHD
jgi:hypothetical protein